MPPTAAGLLFKISAAAFHMWGRIAYEGPRPPPWHGVFFVASKAASIAFLCAFQWAAGGIARRLGASAGGGSWPL